MQVEESTPFAPIARKEIGALAWHVVNELPMTKEQSAMVCVIAPCLFCLPTARSEPGFHQLTLRCVPLPLSRQAVDIET